MKKYLLILLLLIFLCSCNDPPVHVGSSDPGSLQTRQTNAIKPIVVYGNTLNSTGYIVGGLIDGKMVSLQDADNYKYFDLTGEETYTFFPSDGLPFPVRSDDVNIDYVAATGSHEITVTFNEASKMLEPNTMLVGIGNSSISTSKEKSVIDDNGSFLLDFDDDGLLEIIRIHKNGDHDSLISIELENQFGPFEIAKFEIDGTYTSSFELFVIDIDEDGYQELVISLSGHDYSTEIFKISSTEYEMILGYYMGN